MSVSKIAYRYAKPLLEVAIQENELDKVVNDVKGVQNALDNRDLHLMFKSPIIKPSKKLDIVKALFEGKISKSLYNFLTIVIRKGRETILPEILNAFEAQYNDYKGITPVEITTAVAMSEAELSAIKTKLLASKATNKEVEITTVVDPSIIGGFVIKIGDNLYDASVQQKLEKLKKQFSSDDYVQAI